VSNGKFLFFQPASRVMQEESPIKIDGLVANTCDYLIVKPAILPTRCQDRTPIQAHATAPPPGLQYP